MKSILTAALFAIVSLSPAAAMPHDARLAALLATRADAAAQADSYLAAASLVSLGALALTLAVTIALRAVRRAPAQDWQAQVMTRLERDLQSYTQRLQKAA